MAKALYEFKATIVKTLSFREGEYFIIYEPTTKQRNWWQVINSKAQVGYVPSNYVMSMQVSPEHLCKFIDDCISVLRRESDASDGCLPNERQEVLLKLLGRKEMLDKKVEEEPEPPDYPSAPSPSNSISRISPPLIIHTQQNVRPIQSAPIVCQEIIEVVKKGETKSLNQVSIAIKEEATVNGVKQEVSKICGQVGASQLKNSNFSGEALDKGKHSSVNSLIESISNESVFQLVEEVSDLLATIRGEY